MRKHRKLQLSAEAIRSLGAVDLTRVAGAARYYSVEITCAEFTEYRWCNTMPQYCGTATGGA